MTLLILTLNVLGWPVIHLVFARLFLLCPDEYFAHDSWLTRARWFEQDTRIYRRVLAVERWKGVLPDGAPWLGGRSKRRLESRTVAGLSAFLMETRRAEAAHWCMLLFTPVFYLWNPPWACVVMSFYGIAANLPCIVAQRANRIKIAYILHRSAGRRGFQAPLVAGRI
jgi:glycosyl-4,4'-diaponeurosporenoate acyltransferase